MIAASWPTASAIAIGSVLAAEIVRDGYHWFCHQWTPLYRWHAVHHRVFRPDLSVADPALYRLSQWRHDVPEALVMLAAGAILAAIAGFWALAGTIYTGAFLAAAIARGSGSQTAAELTDATHKPGAFARPPAEWFVNRSYHWRHHFDNQRAYYSGTLALVDKLMGTALSLPGKRVAVTGASGTMGRALLAQLQARGAKVTAFSSKGEAIALSGQEIPTVAWSVGREAELAEVLEAIDILILNHGINVHGARTPEAIERSYEINAFSSWRLLELFLKTVRTNEQMARKEVWVNTSEAEVSPAFSPLYELSKRTLGDLVTMRRLDAPCTIRKLILGPFKSNLNPIGVMNADRVARQILNLAVRDVRDIIVTVNPITLVAFPIKELCVSTYFKLFGKASE